MGVLVELRGLANERHDAVGLRQVEEAVDLGVVERRDDAAKRVLRSELVGEEMPPVLFIARERRRVQTVAAKRVVRDLGGEPGAENAVVDGAAGCRLPA